MRLIVFCCFVLFAIRGVGSSQPKNSKGGPSLRRLVKGAVLGSVALHHHTHAQPQHGENLHMNKPSSDVASSKKGGDFPYVRGGGGAGGGVGAAEEVDHHSNKRLGILGDRNPFLGHSESVWEGTNRAGIVSMRMSIRPIESTVEVKLKAPFKSWTGVAPKKYTSIEGDTKYSVLGLTEDEKAAMKGTDEIEVDFKEGPDINDDKIVVTCKKTPDRYGKPQEPYTFTLSPKMRDHL